MIEQHPGPVASNGAAPTETMRQTLRSRWRVAIVRDDRGTLSKASEKAVAFVLYDHMNSSGYCRLSYDTIIREARVGRTTASLAIGTFAEAGWVTVTRGKRRPDGTLPANEYQARLPVGHPLSRNQVRIAA